MVWRSRLYDGHDQYILIITLYVMLWYTVEEGVRLENDKTRPRRLLIVVISVLTADLVGFDDEDECVI